MKRKLTIGERIAFRRRQLNISQAELGKRCGLSDSVICRIEGGKNKRDERIEAIVEALGLSMVEFYGGQVEADGE